MRNHIRTQIPPNPLQYGFVLIVALVLLLVLTVLGLAAAQSTSLEERMAGNARNHDLAFQAAEAGLSAGVNCLQTGAAPCTVFHTGTTGGNGMYVFSPTSTTVIWAQAAFGRPPEIHSVTTPTRASTCRKLPRSRSSSLNNCRP